MFGELDTPFGSMAAGWRKGLLYSCEFVRAAKPINYSPKQVPKTHGKLRQAMERYFETGELEWDLSLLDLADLTDFQRRILYCCAAIPAGKSSTYGELAARSGSPGAARAAGMVMAKNRWPIVIPCHRVVGANGKLVGYSGIGGLATKRQLLELEQSSGSQLSLFPS